MVGIRSKNDTCACVSVWLTTTPVILLYAQFALYVDLILGICVRVNAVSAVSMQSQIMTVRLQVLASDGSGSYSNIIQGMQW